MAEFIQSSSSSSTGLHPKLQKLVDFHHQQTVVKQVDLSNVGLDTFPLETLLPFKDTIEFVNLGGNNLSSLPPELAQFQALKILFFANNQFQSIPTVLGSLPNLYMLSFKSNKLRWIDAESLSTSIRWLILTDNQLTGEPVPIEIILNSNHRINRNTTKIGSIIGT
jgi:Leucine-rich repeat (LRR) protein